MLTNTPGSIFAFSDTQTLQEQQKAGHSFKPLELTVNQIVCLRQNEDLAKWNIYLLENNRFLIEKIVDQNKDYYLMKDSELPIGNRQQNIDAGNLWLFSEPANPNQFNILELNFSADIEETTEAGIKIIYQKKSQGELSGPVTRIPAQTGMNNLLGTIVEYSTPDGKQAVILEIGNIEAPNGGAIQLLTGRKISKAEITNYNK